MRTAIPLPVPSKRAPWNSPPHRPEAPSEAERGLGHSSSASAERSETRSRLVQPCDRHHGTDSGLDPHLSTRQYARIVGAWVESAGLDGSAYGTHSMRRTKAAQILPKLRAFIEHVKYRSADAPRDGTAARKLRKINIVNS